MHKHIENYLSHLLPLLMQRGVEIVSQNEIAWGLQLKLARGSDRANINIYFSEKRGLSRVLGAPKDSALKQELSLLICAEDVAEPFAGFHNWHSWIGSDECGKGDFFGPLVGSAFYVSAEQIPALKKLGVQDSKNLNDIRIEQIAKQIYLHYPNQTACIVLKPRRYNELIAAFKLQGQNLNDLLAWIHETVTMELMAKQTTAEGIIVDQFSKAQKVKSRLLKKNSALNVVERTSAERDIAVAAASILARYQFLQAMDALNKKYKFNFPKGAGPQVISAGRQFIKEQGDQNLPEVAKLHFKTSASIKYQPADFVTDHSK